MTETPDRFARAFGTHDAYEREGDAYRLTTTAFDATVRVEDADPPTGTVTVRAPMLSAAVEDDVGDALEEGWFDTYELRLADAAGATRHDVDVDAEVREVGDEAVAEFAVEDTTAARLPDVAKALVEYAEGTYVEGVVPGYDYRDPVASLVSEAGENADGERGGTPL